MHHYANAMERKCKCNGTVTQQNVKETLRKRFFNANAMERKRKRNGNFFMTATIYDVPFLRSCRGRTHTHTHTHTHTRKDGRHINIKSSWDPSWTGSSYTHVVYLFYFYLFCSSYTVYLFYFIYFGEYRCPFTNGLIISKVTLKVHWSNCQCTVSLQKLLLRL